MQGFLADGAGNITGVQGNLQMSNANLPPLPTSLVDIEVNFDAEAVPPATPFLAGFTPSQTTKSN